jgi:hypothetical protein
MNIRHPGQLKKLKSWGPIWSYQLNRINGLPDLDFFQLPWVPITDLSCFALRAKPPQFLDIMIDF